MKKPMISFFLILTIVFGMSITSFALKPCCPWEKIEKTNLSCLECGHKNVYMYKHRWWMHPGACYMDKYYECYNCGFTKNETNRCTKEEA